MLSVKLFDEDKKYAIYQPSDEENKKINFVNTRFKDMQQARTVVDRDRSTYQTMIDAVLTPYPDKRSSSTVPLASAMIELYVAEATKIQTDFLFKAETSEHQANAKALEYVRKYDWRKNKRKRAMVENEYICAGFGTSVIYTGFSKYNIKQKDPIIGYDMEIQRVERQIPVEKILLENVDIRNFYIDNQAIKGIEDASDCYYEQRMGYDKFMTMSNSKIYKNIDKVVGRNFSPDYSPFLMDEENAKQGNFVKISHYRNVEKDVYIELANGVLIREHPIMSTIDGKKALPFAVRTFGKKNYSIRGRGLCEAVLMFNSEINNLRELLMDGIRRSNTQVLALGNGLSFDGQSFSYDNEILTFDGNLANNFQQLSGNPPNQAIFGYLTQIYKDIAMYVGLDIQNIMGTPSQTAFQTEVQREASQKRINVWLTNRDLAYERLADLHKDNLQKYFPRKTAEGIYPKIEIEDEELKTEDKETGEVDEMGQPMVEQKSRFRKKKGKNMFEVTPELLRGDIYIDVYTNTLAPTINAIDREQKLQYINTVGQIAQGYALAKQSGLNIESILPIKQTLRDLASDFNLEPQNQDTDNQEEVQNAKKDLMSSLQGMMQGGGMSTGGEQPAPEGEIPQGEAPALPPNQPQEGPSM